MFKIKNLSYQVSQKIILNSLNLNINFGESIGIIGKSGSGKTTFLNFLRGIPYYKNWKDISGEIIFLNKNLKSYDYRNLALKIGFLFQDVETQIFSETVFLEIAFSLKNYDYNLKEIKNKILEIATKMHLAKLLAKNPRNLSKGQQQLVALASILVLNPQILLLDEPSTFLDRVEKINLINLIKKWKNENKDRVLILIEHDWEMLTLVKRLIILDEGKLIQDLNIKNLTIKAKINFPKLALVFENLKIPLSNLFKAEEVVDKLINNKKF